MKDGNPKVKPSVREILRSISRLGQQIEKESGKPLCKRCSHPSNMHKAKGKMEHFPDNSYKYPDQACSQCGKTCKFKLKEFPWLVNK